MERRTDIGMATVSFMVLLTTNSVWAEFLSMQDRDAITRLGSTQGRLESEIAPLLDHVSKAGERGLPTESLLNKVREGLAKGVEPNRIDPVLRQMTSRLESAREALQEAGSRGMEEGNRHRAIETLAEAFARGATLEEVRELARISQHEGKQKATQEILAAGAKSLAVMKEGKISSEDGTALIGEGITQGYRSSELLDLGREVKRRGSDFYEGRASLKALREQVRRGERGDRLFKDKDRDESGNRSGGGRGDRNDRGDRGGREDSGRERVDRSDRLDRSDRIERPERTERPDRSDRSGRGRD